jgi:hypothetical protein
MKMKKTKSINTLAKGIIISIPVIILAYILIINFLIPQEFTYFYDIGSKEDNYIGPNFRISEKITEEDTNYREAIGHILYYEIELPINSREIEVKFKLKDNFPENSEIILGARNQENWSYIKHYVQDNKEYLDENWFTVKTTFYIKKENLHTNNKKISLILWMQHLAKEEYKNYTIPIDWINITVYKPGLIK